MLLTLMNLDLCTQRTINERFTRQVKVWFQNRRTKHKRVADDESDQTSCCSPEAGGDTLTGSVQSSPLAAAAADLSVMRYVTERRTTDVPEHAQHPHPPPTQHQHQHQQPARIPNVFRPFATIASGQPTSGDVS